MLDLIFYNMSNISIFNDNTAILPIDILYHTVLLYIKFNIYSNLKIIEYNSSIFVVHRSYFFGLSQALNTYKWDIISKNIDINEATSRFYSIINSCIDIFLPKDTITIIPFLLGIVII